MLPHAPITVNTPKNFNPLTGSTLFCFAVFGGGRFFLIEDWIFDAGPDVWVTVT
jgi:hypothetical protein